MPQKSVTSVCQAARLKYQTLGEKQETEITVVVLLKAQVQVTTQLRPLDGSQATPSPTRFSQGGDGSLPPEKWISQGAVASGIGAGNCREGKLVQVWGLNSLENNFQKETQSEIKGLPSFRVYEGKCEDWILGGLGKCGSKSPTLRMEKVNCGW